MVEEKIEQQIKALVANGLAQQGIESLLGRPFTSEEEQLYRKCRSIFTLQEKKRRQEKKYKHLSNIEAVQ